ncbi:MAG: GDSL-type esterase/lipase family protein [Verrucomicrobiae bacterium]|nr:GDSL-type esterase/lipase family protein [Verrucomicrobiae bacterium]
MRQTECFAQNAEPGKLLSEMLALVGTVPTESTGSIRLKTGDKLAFMGDSITANAGYLGLVAHVLKTQYASLIIPPFINAGMGGQKAENMVLRFEKDMKLAEKPAWVFISVGINDVWHRLEQPDNPKVLELFKVNVTKMVELGQTSGAGVVLLTPTIIQEDALSKGNKRLIMYADAMKEIAVEKQCLVADLHALFLNALANRKTAIRLTTDGAHMAAYGDALMAIGVLRVMGVNDAMIAATDTCF